MTQISVAMISIHIASTAWCAAIYNVLAKTGSTLMELMNKYLMLYLRVSYAETFSDQKEESAVPDQWILDLSPGGLISYFQNLVTREYLTREYKAKNKPFYILPKFGSYLQNLVRRREYHSGKDGLPLSQTASKKWTPNMHRKLLI